MTHESGGPQIQVEIQSAVEQSPRIPASRALTSLTEHNNEGRVSSLGAFASVQEASSTIAKPTAQ